MIKPKTNKSFRHGGKLYSLQRKRDCFPSPSFGLDDKGLPGSTWFQIHWEPCIGCVDMERIGAAGDGGKWVCNPRKELTVGACLVMSIGSNGDFSYEFELIDRFGCDVHIFDHTHSPPSFNTTPAHIQSHLFFHSFGLACTTAPPSPLTVYNNTTSSYSSALATHAFINHPSTRLLNVLFHEYVMKAYPMKQYTFIDLLKIDVEGWEYLALRGEEQLAFISERVIQMNLEVHADRSVDSLGIQPTSGDIATLWHDLVTKANLRTFAKEANIQYNCEGKCIAIEYGLVNRKYIHKYNK